MNNVEWGYNLNIDNRLQQSVVQIINKKKGGLEVINFQIYLD